MGKMKHAINILAQFEDLPEYLYHVTFLKDLDSISNSGLTPSTGQNFGGYGTEEPKVHLTEEGGIGFWFERLERVAEDQSDDQIASLMLPVVLRVHDRLRLHARPSGGHYGLHRCTL